MVRGQSAPDVTWAHPALRERAGRAAQQLADMTGRPTCACGPTQLDGFADDARQAITTTPDYFVRWYTIKSIGLGVAFAALAFMIGRATCKR